MPDCRRLAVRRHRRTPRGATWCFSGPNAPAPNGPAAESESAGSLTAGAGRAALVRRRLLERRRSRWGPRSAGAEPARLEAALPLGWAQPKTPAVKSEVPVTTTGHLSCSCPAAKSKNFVSRARTTALRSVVLPAWDLEELAGPVSTPPAPVLAPLLERPALPQGNCAEPRAVFHFPYGWS